MNIIKKSSFIFLFAGLLVIFYAQNVSSSPSSNLLLNSGFEDGSPTAFLNWTFSPSNSSCSRAIYTGDAHSGSRFLATTRSTDYPNCLSVWQEKYITPQVGQTYTAGFWLRNSTQQSQNVVIALWAIGPNGEAKSETVTLTGTEWSCHQLWFTPTRSGNNRLKIEIYLDQTWNMDINADDLYLGYGQVNYCNTSPPPPYNTDWFTDSMLEGETNTPVENIRYFLELKNSCLAQPIHDVDGVVIDVPQLIYNAAVTHQINPKVLLATMQKEQSAITRCPSNNALRLLMGAGSASTARAQINYAASLFRSYQNDLTNNGQTISGWKVGVAKNTQDGVAVTPATKAVAGQFTYTPYAGTQWGGNNSNIGGLWLFWNAWHNLFNFNQPLPSPSTNTGNTLNVRYVDQVYVQTRLENGYWNHCGPASTAMLLYYEGKESRDVLYNRQATLDLVCELKNNCRGATIASRIVSALNNRGLGSYYDSSPTFDEIRQSIDNNHPVILSIKQASHLVTVVGYDNNNKLIINDPYGGSSWWNYNYPTRRNVPYTGSPQTKGVEIEYTYGQNLTGKYAIFVNGSVSAAQNTVTTWGDSFTNGNVAVSLGTSSQGVAESGNIEIVSFVPAYGFDNLWVNDSVIIEAFDISATDSNGQDVPGSAEPFAITAYFDDDLDLASGITDNPGGTISTYNLIPEFTVLYWNESTNLWEPISITVDYGANEVAFSTQSFGKYALAVQGKYALYLPFIINP